MADTNGSKGLRIPWPALGVLVVVGIAIASVAGTSFVKLYTMADQLDGFKAAMTIQVAELKSTVKELDQIIRTMQIEQAARRTPSYDRYGPIPSPPWPDGR